MEWHESSLPLAWLLPRTADLADQHEERVIEFIHDALFERDNGIVRDANLFRADLGAAVSCVSPSDAHFRLSLACLLRDPPRALRGPSAVASRLVRTHRR